ARLENRGRFSSPKNSRGLTAAPLALRRVFARLRDSFYFGSLPKSLNRFFRRGARLPYRRRLRSGRAGPTSRGREMLTHFHWPPLPLFSDRALAEILFKRELRA
ncbi:hypothetical protein, partial [uncultured Rikenella sp.]|uniref:hypothetical protein n=1 Tax=uncultured Rikenella sp. TaxID=368003 RepID=UPI002619C17F